MKISDILKTKKFVVFSTESDASLSSAVDLMAEHDIGSLLVIDNQRLSGLLTFREVLLAAQKTRSLNDWIVRDVMEKDPLVLSPETDAFETRQKMVERHARYVPIMQNEELVGVLSFYDVAKSMIKAQQMENQLLKAYIRDWPEAETGTQPEV